MPLQKKLSTVLCVVFLSMPEVLSYMNRRSRVVTFSAFCSKTKFSRAAITFLMKGQLFPEINYHFFLVNSGFWYLGVRKQRKALCTVLVIMLVSHLLLSKL